MVIDFLNAEFTVNEGDGMVILTLVKSGLTAMDYDVELKIVPGSAGELFDMYIALSTACALILVIIMHGHRDIIASQLRT